ncbi:MAG: hypothetical protein ABUM26_02315 [Solirubrobacterales bacterium]
MTTLPTGLSFALGWPKISLCGELFGTADASVIEAAERLNVTQVATIDGRHFGIVRPQHVAAFELLP